MFVLEKSLVRPPRDEDLPRESAGHFVSWFVAEAEQEKILRAEEEKLKDCMPGTLRSEIARINFHEVWFFFVAFQADVSFVFFSSNGNRSGFFCVEKPLSLRIKEAVIPVQSLSRFVDVPPASDIRFFFTAFLRLLLVGLERGFTLWASRGIPLWGLYLWSPFQNETEFLISLLWKDSNLFTKLFACDRSFNACLRLYILPNFLVGCFYFKRKLTSGSSGSLTSPSQKHLGRKWRRSASHDGVCDY